MVQHDNPRLLAEAGISESKTVVLEGDMDRMLAPEINNHRSECEANLMRVTRHMTWITRGYLACLVEALEIVEKPKKVMERLSGSCVFPD